MKLPLAAPAPGLVRLHLTPRLFRRASPRGFTLIELLTVIAIVGILAAILIPIVGRVRESARTATCASNLRQIGMSSQLWATDNKGRLPGLGYYDAGETLSANWQDIFNSIVFPSYRQGATGMLQRSGDAPRDGQMYCPSIRPWTTTRSSIRAYIINAHANNPANALKVGPMSPFGSYYHGALLTSFRNPARTFYVWDAERATDILRANTAAPLPQGAIAFDNAEADGAKTMTPWSANGGYYAFRHGGNLNMVFLDGHVGRYSAATFGPLNIVASFHD